MPRALWIVIGGGLAFGVGVALLLRFSELTSAAGLGLVGLTPLLVIPLIGLGISAWVSRAALLRVATVALTIGYVASVPLLGSVLGCQGESADDEIVIFDHNVRYLGGDPAQVAAAAAAAEADVVVLQEVWPEFMSNLSNQASMAQFRYRATEAVAGTTGLAVWSRWPIDHAQLDDLAGHPVLSVDVASPHGSFTVVDVHTQAPIGDGAADRWSAQLAALGSHPVDGPTVLAGDFNATPDHAQFRALVARGWTNVHDPKGCGFDATWPRNRLPVALLRLDHVLVSDQFQVLDVDIGPDAGSDHASVIATIRLAESAPA